MYLSELFDFIKKGKNSLLAVEAGIKMLEAAGFMRLEMENDWSLCYGQSYYISPFPSMLVAIKLPHEYHVDRSFRIIASHTDQPGFIIKPNPEIKMKDYLKLNVEVYGAPIFATWLDRVLNLSGQVILKSENVFKPIVKMVDLEGLNVTIPNLAIHMNREVNKGYGYNPQVDLMPLVTTLEENLSHEGYLLQLISEALQCQIEDILDFQLYLSVDEEPALIGQEKNILSAPRLDNLLMVYTSLTSLIESSPQNTIGMVAAMDNEEVGSRTKQGADSQILSLIVEKMAIALHMDRNKMIRSYSHSFMISADAAHGIHPNHGDKSDPTNQPILNKGVVLKSAANQAYLCDIEATSSIKHLMQQKHIPYQQFVNRSDMVGGKTLGPLLASYLPIKGVDLGVSMLAMHSVREVVGVKDIEAISTLFTAFFNE